MKVAVFLSARDMHERYVKQVQELGSLLVRLGVTTIYGGGYSGMMGVLARTVESLGGDLVGVTTEQLVETEGKGYNKETSLVVQSMGERKDYILKLADVVIVAPGGFGTLDELFEALTYNQLNLAKSKIIIYDNELINPIVEIIHAFRKRGTIDFEDSTLVTYAEDLNSVEEVLKNV